jgi:hypothetical protein
MGFKAVRTDEMDGCGIKEGGDGAKCQPHHQTPSPDRGGGLAYQMAIMYLLLLL